MRRNLALVLVLSLAMIHCGSSKPPASADPTAFIDGGNAFLKGIMSAQIHDTYAQWVSPGAKYNPAFSLEQFTADWEAILQKYGPIESAELTSYQLVPGRRVGQLYYRVQHANLGPVVYHLVAEKDRTGRATIFIIDVGNAQVYPPAGNPGEKQTPAQKIEILP